MTEETLYEDWMRRYQSYQRLGFPDEAKHDESLIIRLEATVKQKFLQKKRG